MPLSVEVNVSSSHATADIGPTAFLLALAGTRRRQAKDKGEAVQVLGSALPRSSVPQSIGLLVEGIPNLIPE
jgi:hypothetical protein